MEQGTGRKIGGDSDLSDRQKRMLVGLVSGLLFSLIVYSLTNSPGSFFTELIQGYELRSYDERMRSRASFSEEGSIDQVVVVDIDLSSIEAMGNYYDWPHAYHGQLIDVMSSGAPGAILFDIIFDPKSSYEHELVGALALACQILSKICRRPQDSTL